MFILKNKHFYFLFILTICVLLGFSVWGYMALMNNGGYQSYEIKFIAESFIFTALFLTSLIAIFYILIIHKSINVYNELDKIYELFDKGNYYTQNSFNKLGVLGGKILRINKHLIADNDLKAKKISSDSKIINFLLNQSHEEILILNDIGKIKRVSKAFLEKNDISKEQIIDTSFDNIVEKFEFINIYKELKRGQYVTLKRNIALQEDKESVQKYMVVFPIFNINFDLTNAVCLFVSEGRFKNYSQKSKNYEPGSENIYKSNLIKKINDLFS